MNLLAISAKTNRPLMKLILSFPILVLISCLNSYAQTIRINEVMSSNEHIIEDEDGDFGDWIELYNSSDTPVSLSGYHLTDDSNALDKWTFPEITIGANDYLIIYISGKNRVSPENNLHCNFKLKASGEKICLSNALLEIIDSIPSTRIAVDHSFGRLPDGTDNLGYLSYATPGNSNNGVSLVSQIFFSRESGFYKDSFYLKLDCLDSVFYTLDGSDPNSSSFLYTDSILISSKYPNHVCLIPTNGEEMTEEFRFRAPSAEINKALLFKASVFKNGEIINIVYSQSYFTTNVDYSFPVMSIATDYENLFAAESGIYVPGTSYNAEKVYESGNYNMRGLEWEKKVSVDFFDEDGLFQFSENTGLRIAGSRSRNGPQKSLRFYFRSEYGASAIEYPFFEEREDPVYKRLVLRSPFSYWWKRNTLFQDDILHDIVRKSGSSLDIQASEPVVVFLNGEYWGIQNLRERQDRYYLANLHGVHEDSLDIVGGNLIPVEGSATSLVDLVSFVEKNDLSLPSNYNFVSSQIDVDNFIDYFIFETFFGNRDWPGNNVKLWRTREKGGKWRFLFYDMDGAIGDVNGDPFDFEGGTKKVVVLFNGLCENADFENKFVDRYLYYLETSLAPENVKKIYTDFKSRYSKEVDEHIERWGNPSSYSDWEENCQYFMDFMETRPCIVKSYLKNYFESRDVDEFDCYSEVESKELKLYPNPSGGQVNLVFEDVEVIQGDLFIYNTAGQIVHTASLVGGNHQYLDLSFLVSGMYIVRIEQSEYVLTEKLIIHN